MARIGESMETEPSRLDLGGDAMISTLLVEDNAALRVLLKETLGFRFPSMRILEACDGKEALEAFQQSPPDLVLMDIQLPGESGLSLTRRIRNLFPDTTVIILTSYDFPEYREAAYRQGALHFLTKGDVNTDTLAQIIQSVFPDSLNPM
jgi:two-component system response regulator DegU